MYLLEFLDMVEPRIIGGDVYTRECYGHNARWLDLEMQVSIVFDAITYEIYEITVNPDGGGGMCWRQPNFETAYEETMKMWYGNGIVDQEFGFCRSNCENSFEIAKHIVEIYNNPTY